MAKADDKEIDALIELAFRRQCEDDFYTFVQEAWPIVEGGKKFIGGWAVQVTCEHLEEVYYGRIKRLLINEPPRTSKSTVVSVMFPVWCWLKNPSLQIFSLSYAEKLAMRDNVKSRRLIKSSWFQKRWPHLILSEDQDTKIRVDNMHGGYRVVAGMDGSITGDGGDLITCFPHDTLIKTDAGDKLIGDIVEKKIQCSVLSYSHIEDQVQVKEIEKYYASTSDEILEIQYENGSIKCTSEHPIFVENKGYIRADSIREGDVIYAAE